MVAVRDRCRRAREQRGERPEDQVDVVACDQLLVVRDRLARIGRVVDDLQLDLASEEAAVRVDVGRPEVVAALHRLPRIGEVAAERERDPDLDRPGAAGRRPGVRGRRDDRGGDRCNQGYCEQPRRSLRHRSLLCQTSRLSGGIYAYHACDCNNQADVRYIQASFRCQTARWDCATSRSSARRSTS